MLSGSPNPDLSQTKKGGGRAWGEDLIVDVGPFSKGRGYLNQYKVNT